MSHEVCDYQSLTERKRKPKRPNEQNVCQHLIASGSVRVCICAFGVSRICHFIVLILMNFQTLTDRTDDGESDVMTSKRFYFSLDVMMSSPAQQITKKNK